jgi:hypothetical protein
MLPNILPAASGALLLLCGFRAIAAESLEERLRASNIPIQKFTGLELRQEITSYAISEGDPFLLAYYVDDRSGRLQPPLHVIRFARKTEDLRRADLADIEALFQGEVRMDCLGSALGIREYHDTIFIETHRGPSAGCVIVLSSVLSFKAVLSGWLLGLLGSDYAIVRRSEVHFQSVQPLHIEVFDLKRNRSVEVYPPKEDGVRRQYSRLIQPRISEKWCMEHNAQCDPENFDTGLIGGLAVNEVAKVLGFEAKFDAAGFGDAAEKQVRPRSVLYIFRERGGKWQHREFDPVELRRRFGVLSIQELVTRNPDAAFEPVTRK